MGGFMLLLLRYLEKRWFMEFPEKLTIASHTIKVTGRYSEYLRELSCPFGKDLQAVEKLYEICEGY